MKKLNLTIILTVFIAALLSVSCSNVFVPFSAPNGEQKANVTVSFSAGTFGKTILPSTLDFDRYDFTFTNEGSGYDETFSRAKSTGGTFEFTIPPDSDYSLNVKAYKTGVANAAAEGNSTELFTIGSSPVNISVRLTGNLSGGPNGDFSYCVRYPAGSKIESFSLIGIEGDIELYNEGHESGVYSGKIEIPAGWYELEIILSLREKTAFDYDVVRIYSDTATIYEYTFNNKDFTNDDYLYDWYGFNIEGLSHYFNNDTADETVHFTPSRAVGAHFNTFTDANGETWNNVLKIIQPEYTVNTSSTVTMTYPTQEAGTYTLSMWFWLEENIETATFSWYNTGGKRANDAIVPGDQLRAWRPLGSDSAQARGKWIPWQGTIDLLEDEELCLIVRNGSNSLGVKSAPVYIRDLALIINGEIVIDTDNGVKVTPNSVIVVEGKTRQLTASKPVFWSSDKNYVATVSGSGLITAVSKGTAVITAELADDPAVFAKVTVKVVEEGDQYIALTFDDAGSFNFRDTLSITDDLLNLLEEKDVKATFFIPGHYEKHSQFTRQDMDLRIKRMFDNGHEIGNHAYNHLYNYEFWQLYGEIVETDALIANAIGDPNFKTKHFRPPNGDPSGNNAVNVAALLGKTVIIWDSDSVDYAAPGDTSFLYPGDERLPPMTFGEKVDDIYDRITLGRARLPGEIGGIGETGRIVLLHAIYPHTVPAVSRAIDTLREEGFVFVNVTELLQRRGDYAGPGEVISPQGEKTHGFSQWHENFKFVDPSQRYLALEFNEPLNGSIVSALDGLDIKANFFVAGAEAGANENLLRGMYQNGHEIGSLSWTRNKKYPTDGDLLKQEIIATDAKLGEIFNVNNYKTKYFMPPDGLLQDNYERIAAAAAGKSIVLWDEDYSGASLSRAGIAEHIASTNQSIFIISDTGNLDNDWFCGIAILKARGYQFLTLTDFMARKGITLNPGDVYNMELGPLPPPEEEPVTPGISFEWAEGQIPLTVSVNSGTLISQNPVIVTSGSSVTITAPQNYSGYEWAIDRNVISEDYSCTIIVDDDCTITLLADNYSKYASFNIKVQK